MPHTTTDTDLAAVLWDMDGTLVDTEPYWIAVELAMSAEQGGTWDESLAEDLVGLPLQVSAAELQRRAGLRGTVEEIIDEMIARVIDKIATEGLPWRPGARELLTELGSAGVPCALVTMSWRRLTDVVLAGLDPCPFEVIVTGDEVTQGKPHPEPYLRAAEELGVDPAACVAIEDSLPGLASAEASGAAVLGVQAKVPIPAAPGRSRLSSLTGVTVAQLRQIVGGSVQDRLLHA
ncbi:HAD family hydrolase [Ruania alba]|uniref:Haloacid dehalogenase superfamily, subfamily IA, variant 3 with third motif having DD or ED n=1 Tax=Ruania alba TaxID=648782 RepID=A0A1H5GMJ1_9MICO|nr:HAD family phosphatase [Ruania alba]SEE16929.1 haloacid dehalogenase superfamily, subfamily IA, variant 3 with third motif having DD or ED [Ruania alba]